MLLVFSILAATIVLFISDRLPLDLVAILALLTLLLCGVLTVDEALAGFSDSIVLTMAGLFVVGAGLFQTGIADLLSRQLSRMAGSSEIRLIGAIMVLVALLSAFISSTGTVAVFLPVVVSLALRAQISPARLMMPLAYASLLGGMLTLIGTPPNIVVNNQLRSSGVEPFNFFAFTPIGLVMLVLGVGYMLLVGRRLLRNPANEAPDPASPAPTPVDLMSLYGLPGNLFRARVLPNSPLIGQNLAQANLRARFQVSVIANQPPQSAGRTNDRPEPAGPATLLASGDTLLLKGPGAKVAELAQDQQLELVPADESADALLAGGQAVVEIVLTPRSRLIGQTVRSMRFRDRYRVSVIAILRQGATMNKPTSQVELRFGDTLLVIVGEKQMAILNEERDDFVVIGQHRTPEAQPKSRRAPVALAIMLAMLVVITIEGLPTVTAVLLAAAAMVLTGCVTMKDAYRAINWESLVLIAGMLPMATALEKTGGMTLIANSLTVNLGGFGPLAVIAGL
ncbi:MAG: SLC13 family permease, partial [Oscillochloris sp.]|nr:SLC13 family permease [Oscillochloris sp.]